MSKADATGMSAVGKGHWQAIGNALFTLTGKRIRALLLEDAGISFE